MAKYISLDAVLAEIEELNTALNEKINSGIESSYWRGLSLVCEKLKFRINSLEVKEVDLEKEIQRQYNVHKNPDNSIVKDCVIMTKDGFEYFAKHFFELGIKAQKGE